MRIRLILRRYVRTYDYIFVAYNDDHVKYDYIFRTCLTMRMRLILRRYVRINAYILVAYNVDHINYHEIFKTCFRKFPIQLSRHRNVLPQIMMKICLILRRYVTTYVFHFCFIWFHINLNNLILNIAGCRDYKNDHH